MANNALDPPPLYTTAEASVLAFTPYLTAPLSMVGSALIIWSIMFKRKELLQTVYHRIMLGMSSVDFLASSGMVVLGPWAVPENFEYGRSGRGNAATCEASGFFLNFTFGSMWYSGFLAVHFVMLIRWEWKERTIACCLEPFGHLFGFVFLLTNNLTAIQQSVFNPLRDLPGWCWFSDYPPFCNENEHVDCVRGETYNEFTGSMSLGLVVFIFVVIIICMFFLVLKVRRLERNMQQYTVGQMSLTRTKETSHQALLYIAAFLLAYSPLVVVNRLRGGADDPNEHKSAIFVFALLAKFLTPLQGCLNSIVYFRRRFASLIREGESLAFLKQIPILGPWIAERSTPHRAARTTTTTQCTSVGSRPLQQEAVADESNETPVSGPEHNGKGTTGQAIVHEPSAASYARNQLTGSAEASGS